MSDISKHLAAIAEQDKRDQADAERERRFDDSRRTFLDFKELVPWGTDPEEWAERFRTYIAAASVLEAMKSDKPANRVGQDMTLVPLTRLREVASKWANSVTEFGTPIGKLILTAIDSPDALAPMLTGILESPRCQSLQYCLEDQLADAVYDEPPRPTKQGTEAPRAPDSKPATPRFQFIKRGEYFDILFDDEYGMVRCLAGGHDYLRLLKSPNQEISCDDLSGSVRSGVSAVSDQKDNQDQLDRLKDSIRDIDEMLQSEPENHLLQQERQKILDQASAMTGLGGRARPADAAARSRVKNRMSTFLEACRAGGLHKFSAFLGAHVTTGASCKYEPPANQPAWNFS